MELAEWFLAGLREYDGSLSAIYDDQEDAIHLIFHKSGRKSLAYSVSRETGELYPELQRRILKELPLHDIWKRFGSGKAYDDYLFEEEERNRKSRQRDFDNKRKQMFKDAKWEIRSVIENARAGRFDQREAKPYEIPRVTVLENIPKEGESEKT